MSSKLLTVKEKKSIQDIEPIKLSTANGTVECTKVVTVWVKLLQIRVKAILMDNSPELLSMGLLVKQNHFTMTWNPNELPYLTDKDGVKYSFPVHANIPHVYSVKKDCENTKDAENVEPAVREYTPRKTRKVAKRTSSKDCVHNIFTHFPKSKDCPVCRDCKTDRAACRTKSRGENDNLPPPQQFGDALTADHAIVNDGDMSRDYDKVACIMQDRYANWLQAYPAKTKNAEDTAQAFRRFLGPQTQAKHMYTDNSLELEKALRELKIDHDTSTPHRPQTNGVAERAARRVKEGTSCTLNQSGWNDEWWSFAMSCYCFLRNVVDLLVEGITPWEKRFGSPFQGPLIPFELKLIINQFLQKIRKSFTKWDQSYYLVFFWDITKDLVVLGQGMFSLQIKNKYEQPNPLQTFTRNV